MGKVLDKVQRFLRYMTGSTRLLIEYERRWDK